MPTKPLFNLTDDWTEVSDSTCVLCNKTELGYSVYIYKGPATPAGNFDNQACIELVGTGGSWAFNQDSSNEKLYARMGPGRTGKLCVVSET